MSTDFEKYPSIPRLKRTMIITEKIDGSNAQILIGENGEFLTGSRNRWITPEDDNFGFSTWAHANKDALVAELGFGRHYGEWWGEGIQRRYGIVGKRFSLFNTSRWATADLKLCSVVPVLYTGDFSVEKINAALEQLQTNGSAASPGFMRPEGVVVFLTQANHLYKVTLEHDAHKGAKE